MEYIPVEKLLDGASFLFGMTPEAITGPSRKGRNFRARSAVALAARVAGYSYPQIACQLGRKGSGKAPDHKWSMHACDRAEQFYKDDPQFKRRCDMLINMTRKFREASNDNDIAGDGPSAPARAASVNGGKLA